MSKNLNQLRKKYPDIAKEYTRNLEKVKSSPDLVSYQELYNSVLKFDEITPLVKAELLSPLTDAARKGEMNALKVISFCDNDAKFESALQAYVEKTEDFSSRNFSDKYRMLSQKLEGAYDNASKRSALFEIAALLLKMLKSSTIDGEFQDLLRDQLELFETRILDHDAAIKLTQCQETSFSIRYC